MLARIFDFALAHRLIVLMAAGCLAVLGALAFGQLPLDAFPDLP